MREVEVSAGGTTPTADWAVKESALPVCTPFDLFTR